MKLQVQTSGLKRIEHDIAPPMRHAITLPLTAEMGARGADVVLYISVPVFGPVGTSMRELQAIADEIVERLKENV